jgi:hypothetical protein
LTINHLQTPKKQGFQRIKKHPHSAPQKPIFSHILPLEIIYNEKQHIMELKRHILDINFPTSLAVIDNLKKEN